MRYTLTSHGVILGEAAAELPPPSAASRAWQFVPTEEFREVAPIFAALPEAIMDGRALPLESELSAMMEADRADHIREIMRTDPGWQRIVAISEQIVNMQLTLTDTTGSTLEANSIGVATLELPEGAFDELVASDDPKSKAWAAAGPPFYILVANVD